MVRSSRKRQKPQIAHSATASDLGADGPAALARPSRLIDADRGNAGVKAREYVIKDLLQWYNARALLTDRQTYAGLRLRELWTAAGRDPSVISKYGDVVYGGGSDYAFDDRDALRDALKAIAGPSRDVVMSAACLDQSAAGRMPMLRAGLNDLVVYFGVSRDFSY